MYLCNQGYYFIQNKVTLDSENRFCNNGSFFISTLIWEWFILVKIFNSLRNHIINSMFIMPNMSFIAGCISCQKLLLVAKNCLKSASAPLSWNLVPRLIWVCKIQWWCSLFLFLTRNTLFGQVWWKNSNLSV